MINIGAIIISLCWGAWYEYCGGGQGVIAIQTEWLKKQVSI